MVQEETLLAEGQFPLQGSSAKCMVMFGKIKVYKKELRILSDKEGCFVD